MKKSFQLLGMCILSIVLVTGCSFQKKDSKKIATLEFTDREMTQTVDISDATSYTVKDDEDISITKEGTYVLSGTANEATIMINVDSLEKVQLVLDGLSITNSNFPCIYVKNADKVFITTTGDNSLSVTGTFKADGETNTDAVIYSKDDLVLNGTGSLSITSTDNGITSKDDLKITGGEITITCTSDAIEANESVAIADGNITLNSKKDGIHVEYEEDNTTGYFYMVGGNLTITATDDGIHAITNLQIDGGVITITAAEGLEATIIQINGGTITITASDDGINAAKKSKSMTPSFEITGGELTIDMGRGDTDAIDSNGDLFISGGTVTINAQFPFDYDGEASYTGGTMIINGEETTEITNQFMGGPGEGSQAPGGSNGRRR